MSLDKNITEKSFGPIIVQSNEGGSGGAVTSVNGKTGDVYVTKADVGLSQADNTSDLNKPISTQTQAALNAITTEVNKKPNQSDIPDVSNFVTSTTLESTKAELETEISTKQPKGDYAPAGNYALKTDIPAELPNPYALTINGKSYDGSTAVSVTIEGGGSGGGSDGATFTPKATTPQPNTLHLEWTNDKGLSNPASVDIVAPTGAKGDEGAAATIAVGTVTTGVAGSSATVTNIGTSNEAVFDFSIPKGADGSKGNPGDAATVSVGTVTTLEAGAKATVTNSGTSSEAVFDFAIPKGVDGDKGDAGTSATITVGTVTTGAAGTMATVTNSGTTRAAVFDFTIPRGDTGTGGGSVEGAVLYTAQSLTDEQRAQANSNLGTAQTDLHVDWVQGNTDFSGAVIAGSAYHAITPLMDWQPTVNIPEGYALFSATFYNADDSYSSKLNSVFATGAYAVPSKAPKMRLVLQRLNWQAIEADFLKVNAFFRGRFNLVAVQEPTSIRSMNVGYRSLACKCAFENNALEMPNMAFGFVWVEAIDSKFKFYISDGYHANKQFIFDWDLPDRPDKYSMAVVGDGDILAVFRTQSDVTSSVVTRKNPQYFERASGYQRTEIKMQENASLGGMKPNGWIANQGFTVDNSKGQSLVCYFAEYAEGNIEHTKVFLWKISGTPKSAYNWKIVDEQVLANNGNIGMRHYHVAQIDPYTGYLYATTGDDDTASYIFVSKDDGATFETVYGPDETYCRLLNFVFHEDAVYWATDSGAVGKHQLFKATRDVNNVIDVANAEILYNFPDLGGFATYATVDMKANNCLVFLGRADSITAEPNPMYVWDFEDNTMKIAGYTHSSIEAGSSHGFRCQYFHLNTTDNKILVSWDTTLYGRAVFTNSCKELGNYQFAQIHNYIININRIGSKFTMTLDTVK